MIDEAFSMSERFFSLPALQKSRYGSALPPIASDQRMRIPPFIT
jgi:hypothetical protein